MTNKERRGIFFHAFFPFVYFFHFLLFIFSDDGKRTTRYGKWVAAKSIKKEEIEHQPQQQSSVSLPLYIYIYVSQYFLTQRHSSWKFVSGICLMWVCICCFYPHKQKRSTEEKEIYLVQFMRMYISYVCIFHFPFISHTQILCCCCCCCLSGCFSRSNFRNGRYNRG